MSSLLCIPCGVLVMILMTCFSVGSSARPWSDLCDWVGTKAHINLINICLRCAKGLLHFPGLPRNI